MDAGEVEEIRVPAGPSGRFRVRMRVRKDLHPLIRVDSVASIQNDGLVGNKFVQIQTGTDAAPPVADNGTIQSREPFDIADLMQTMSDTLATVNTMLVDVKGRIDEALVAVSATATDAQALMLDDGRRGPHDPGLGRRVSTDLTAIVGNVRQGRGTIGKLLNDDALYTSVKAMAADAEKAMATVREASDEARDAIADLRGENGPVKGLTGDVQQTLQSARDAMADLADTTEALKRNFFFRGFFNRRGYFDLDDVSVAQYRQGALESKDRRVLRIWLGAGCPVRAGCQRASNGSATGGTARLDSAMSQFVRYPPNEPVRRRRICAGRDGRCALSQQSARAASSSVTTSSGSSSSTRTMWRPCRWGRRRREARRADEWDGVALAMFVPTAGLIAGAYLMRSGCDVPWSSAV